MNLFTLSHSNVKDHNPTTTQPNPYGSQRLEQKVADLSASVHLCSPKAKPEQLLTQMLLRNSQVSVLNATYKMTEVTHDSKELLSHCNILPVFPKYLAIIHDHDQVRGYGDYWWARLADIQVSPPAGSR